MRMAPGHASRPLIQSSLVPRLDLWTGGIAHADRA